MRASAAVFPILVGVACFLIQPAASAQKPNSTVNEDAKHFHWLVDRMVEAGSVKVGMTRADLLKVIIADGGFHSTPQEYYVLRRCSLIKVKVTFELPKGVTRQNLDQLEQHDAADTAQDLPLNSQIKITSVSKPYLESMYAD
jgi:hypothetical protein